MKPSPRTLVAAVLATVLAFAPFALAFQDATEVALGASSDRISYGQSVRLTGNVDGGDGCAMNRDVYLEAAPADASGWDEIDYTATNGEGAFEFQLTPDSTAAYRVRLPEDLECAGAVSSEVPVEVRAAVSSWISASKVQAGRCARVQVTVLPSRPGAEIRLEQRGGGEWRPIFVGALDDASAAEIPACYGWGSIGKTFRLRARWPGDGLHAAASGPTHTVRVVKARWMRRIDRITNGLRIGVSVRDDGRFLYRRSDSTARTPASNQKLMLSMGLLDRLGPGAVLPTFASAATVQDGVVTGDLWIRGTGDPTMGKAGMDRLARRVAAAGVARVRGRVMGSTSYFSRDWFATGWKSSFPSRYVALPTALTFEGNRHKGRHIRDPEKRAARWLTRRLRAHGVTVGGSPGAGRHPSGLVTVAVVQSPSLASLLGRVNRLSANFDAEVLGKRLGREVRGAPGTIAKGASAISSWATSNGRGASAYDASGLSYANRVTPASLVRQLGVAEAKPWGKKFRGSLARPGQGTLRSRLSGVRVRAKTGTLTRISALSGYVRSSASSSWVEFSIISQGLSKSRAAAIEDRVVRILARSAR